MWAQLSFLLSQITRLRERQTNRRTDRRTDSFLMARPRCMQRGKIMYSVLLFYSDVFSLMNYGAVYKLDD